MTEKLWQTREFSVGGGFEGAELEFRIEVFELNEGGRPGKRFRVRVWSHESARLTLKPGVFRAQYFDNSVLTQFDLLDHLEFSVETPDEAAEACMEQIRGWVRKASERR